MSDQLLISTLESELLHYTFNKVVLQEHDKGKIGFVFMIFASPGLRVFPDLDCSHHTHYNLEAEDLHLRCSVADRKMDPNIHWCL